MRFTSQINLIFFVLFLTCANPAFSDTLSLDQTSTEKKLIEIARDFQSTKNQNVLTINFSSFGLNKNIDLVPTEILSKNYASTSRTVSGIQAAEPEVYSFKSTSEGYQVSNFARITIFFDSSGKTRLLGLVEDNGRLYSIQKGFDRLTSQNAENLNLDQGVFNTKYKRSFTSEHNQDEVSISDFNNFANTENSLTISNRHPILRIASEADYEMIKEFSGDSKLANGYIAAVINAAEAVYLRELNIGLSLVYQNTWEGSDPYSKTEIRSAYDEFRYNFSAMEKHVNYDLAYLFSARKMSGGNIGWSAIQGACRPGFKYAISGIGENGEIPSFANLVKLFVHESGHNFGADHYLTGNSNVNDCDSTYIMCPLPINQRIGFFSDTSKSAINYYLGNVDQRIANCIDWKEDKNIPGPATVMLASLEDSYVEPVNDNSLSENPSEIQVAAPEIIDEIVNLDNQPRSACEFELPDVTSNGHAGYEGFILFNTKNGVRFEKSESGVIFLSAQEGLATGTVQFANETYPYAGSLAEGNGRKLLYAKADINGTPLHFELEIKSDYEANGKMALGNDCSEIYTP